MHSHSARKASSGTGSATDLAVASEDCRLEGEYLTGSKGLFRAEVLLGSSFMSGAIP